MPVRNPEWLTQYRSFNKIDENISLELSDFLTFFETRRKRMLDILVDKLQLDANGPDFVPNIELENDYIEELDEVEQEVVDEALVTPEEDYND